MNPLATVIVVTWNGADLLRACLSALQAQRGELARFRTVVVDNASVDGTVLMLEREFGDVEVIASPVNVGFAGGSNLALRDLETPYAVLLNNDAEPRPDWLHELLRPLEAPGSDRIAATTSKVLLQDGHTVNNLGGTIYSDGYGADIGFGRSDDANADADHDVLVFSGTAVAIRRTALQQTGVFDDRYFLYYEDTDLAWRVRLAGWRIRFAARAVVLHRHSASSHAGSKQFVFYNERNRLVTLTKNAPARMALLQVLRFPVTTAAIATRKLRRVHVPDANQFSVRLRVKVMASYLRLLPVTLRRRREVARHVPAGIRPARARRALTREFEPVSRRRTDS